MRVEPTSRVALEETEAEGNDQLKELWMVILNDAKHDGTTE